uniref:Uncharacterized protein n=1 Tax=Oryza nivara TaxID=4536 RepID=A0A0E0GXD2_ORYNI
MLKKVRPAASSDAHGWQKSATRHVGRAEADRRAESTVGPALAAVAGVVTMVQSGPWVARSSVVSNAGMRWPCAMSGTNTKCAAALMQIAPSC